MSHHRFLSRDKSVDTENMNFLNLHHLQIFF